MINSGLVNYFKEGIVNGNSVESLKTALIDAKWNEGDINDSLNVALDNKAKPLPTIPIVSNYSGTSVSLGKKERPIGVSILAVIIWINSGFFALFALLSLFLFSVLASFIGGFGGEGGDVWILSIVSFVVLGLFSVFGYFYGKGFWEGRNEWRIFYLVMGGLAILMGISGLFTSPGSSVFQLVIAGFLFWYIGFKKNVVEFFKK